MVSELLSNLFTFEEKLTLFKSTFIKAELGYFPSYKCMLEKYGAVHRADVYVNKIGSFKMHLRRDLNNLECFKSLCNCLVTLSLQIQENLK